MGVLDRVFQVAAWLIAAPFLLFLVAVKACVVLVIYGIPLVLLIAVVGGVFVYLASLGS